MGEADPSAMLGDYYGACREELLGYFRRRRFGAAEAEDLLHETFLRLARDPRRLAAARSVRAYLYGIARHVSLDAWRRARRRPSEDVTALDTNGSIAAADHRGPDLAAALADLPALSREILDLRFQHDLSYADMAEALGIPIGTVRSRLHHALRRLRAVCETREM